MRRGRRPEFDVGVVLLVVFLAAFALGAGAVVHELWPW